MAIDELTDFEDGLVEEPLRRYFHLYEIYTRLDLERIVSIRNLMTELSITPDNEVLFETLIDHMKPFIIKNKIKPSMFSIPPGD